VLTEHMHAKLFRAEQFALSGKDNANQRAAWETFSPSLGKVIIENAS